MLEINLTLPIMMVMFLVFAITMNAVFFGPVTRALEARRAHVAEQQERSAQAIAESKTMQADYETRLKAAQVQAHEAIAAAMKEAEGRRQTLLEQVKADVAKDIEAARVSIREERDRAVAGLSGEVTAFSDLIQRKVLTSTQAPSLAGAPTTQQGA
jgi:F-type H+-transporting ATPase subunit b